MFLLLFKLSLLLLAFGKIWFFPLYRETGNRDRTKKKCGFWLVGWCKFPLQSCNLFVEREIGSEEDIWDLSLCFQFRYSHFYFPVSSFHFCVISSYYVNFSQFLLPHFSQNLTMVANLPKLNLHSRALLFCEKCERGDKFSISIAWFNFIKRTIIRKLFFWFSKRDLLSIYGSTPDRINRD